MSLQLLLACYSCCLAPAFSCNVGEESDIIEDKGNHGIFFSTFVLIILAEFGDKTQIAVAGLASTVDPTAVWLGASLAQAVTSGIGVLAGRTALQNVPIVLLHRLSGSLFILFGISALLSLWW
jgi:putative Ca2+/H+ antiporter (TMEM165/GDT1 family)